MLEKRHFHVGLNTDDEDKLLQDGEYRFALNVRSGSSDEADTGAITNVKGNTQIPFTLPGGTKIVIGAEEDPAGKRIIYFVFNSDNQHQILQYSYRTKSISLILQDSVLNFQKDKYIWHIDVVNGNLLYWTDNFNDPRKLNIDRAILPSTDPNGFPTPFKEQYINNVQEPPLCGPEVKYDTDASKKSNNLKDKLFQFKYQYTYRDGEKSVWSPISKLPLPDGEEYEIQVTFLPVYENNVIKLILEPGDLTVDKIKIAGRIGNLGDFFLITTLDRSDFGTGTFEYEFFNDGIYSSIEINESNRNFDRVPFQVAAQSVIDGNKLTYSNFLEGRDAVSIDMKLTPIYSNKTINTSLDIFTLQLQGTKQVNYTITNTSGGSSPMADDNIFNLTIFISGNLGTFQYLVNSEPNDTSEDIINRFIDQINTDDNNIFFTATKLSTTQFQVNSTDKTFLSTVRVDAITRTIRGFKRGAWHELGITYYDFALRSGAVNDSDSGRVYVNFYPDTPDGEGAASIDVEINHNPPIWARKWQLLYSLNQTVENSIQFTTNIIVQSGSKISLSLEPIELFADDNPNSILSYSFTKGDRVRFIRQGNGLPYTQLVDVEILEFDQSANKIAISNKIPINIAAGTLFEIYTPKKNIETKIYREIGECFDILNPGTDDRAHQGNFQDQAPITVTIPLQTIVETVLAINVVGGAGPQFFVSLFTPNSSVITNLIDNGIVNVGNSITLSNAGAYNGTFVIAKLRSITTSNVSNSYIRLSVPGLPLINQNVTMTIIVPAQTGGGPAIVKLINEGDVYYKARTMVTTGTTKKTLLVEDFNYSDLYDSRDINIGRPNVVDEDFKEIRRPATVFVSEAFIPDTNINGLNSFFGFSFPDTPARAKDYDKSLGSIQRTYSENKRLIIFQELKVGSALINESVTFDQEGVPTINKSNEILSDMIPYKGEWGIGTQPGSFAVYGERKYFADMRRGSVLRLSQNGITEISEYKMHNFFTDTFKESIQGLDDPRIFAVYDKKFNEYILSIELTIDETVIIGQVHKIAGSTHEPPFSLLGPIHNFFHGLFSVSGTTLINVGATNIGLFTDIDFVEVTYTNAVSGLEITQLVPMTGISGDDIQIRLIEQSALNDGDSVTIKFGKQTITSEDIITTYFLAGSPPSINILNLSLTDFTFIKNLNLNAIEATFLNRTTNNQITTILVGIIFLNGQIRFDLPTGITLNDFDEVRIINTKLSAQIIDKFQTIAFNDDDGQQRWKTFYSYEPEMMVSSDTDIITFKDGQLYRHNDNVIRNNFYGEQFTSIIELIFNMDFSTRKFWLALTEEANKIWEAIRITNQNGQKTNLIEADFENIEGDF